MCQTSSEAEIMWMCDVMFFIIFWHYLDLTTNRLLKEKKINIHFREIYGISKKGSVLISSWSSLLKDQTWVILLWLVDLKPVHPNKASFTHYCHFLSISFMVSLPQIKQDWSSTVVNYINPWHIPKTTNHTAPCRLTPSQLCSFQA